jgi:cytochrome c556
MHKPLKIVAAIAGLTFLATATAGDDPLEDAIKARRGFMQVVVFNVGPLFGMAKGKIDYDAEAAATYASNLKAAAMMNNGALWPEGSANEFYSGVTRALPEIWTTYPKVSEANQAWKDATNEVADVAGNGLDALRSKIGAVGDSCKGCHDDFRAEDF